MGALQPGFDVGIDEQPAALVGLHQPLGDELLVGQGHRVARDAEFLGQLPRAGKPVGQVECPCGDALLDAPSG